MNTNRTPTTKTTGVEDVAVSMATRVGTLLSGLAIQSLLAYALLPAGRGEFAICILFSAILGVLMTPGADAGSQYYVIARKITTSEGVSVSFLLCIVGTTIASVLAIPLINSNIAFFRKAESSAFYWALALVPVSAFSNALRHQLAGHRRFKHLALYSFIQTATNGLSLVALVVGLRLGVDGAIVAGCIGNLALIVACLRDLRQSASLKWQIPSRNSIIMVLKYGIRYYVARVGWGVDVRAGILILGLLAGTAEIGIFAVASGLMMRFVAISNAVFVALLPRSADHTDGRPSLVAFCARVATFFTGVATILFLVVSRPMVQLFLSENFVPIVPLAFIVAPGVVMFAGANILTAYFRGVDRPEVCSRAVGVGVAINFVLLPLLYPSLGLVAAALAMTIGLGARSSMLALAYSRQTGISPRSVWLPHLRDIRDVWRALRQTILSVAGR